jgi:hypothetical protein
MKEKQEKIGFYVKLTEEEYKIVRDLKDTFAINISQLFKNYIVNIHKKLQKSDYQKDE